MGERAPEDLDERELLLELNRQLAQTNALLGQLVGDGDEEGEMYRCQSCGAHVGADERRRHLNREHNAPPETPLMDEFEPA